MAKLKRGVARVSGRLGDEVYVNSKKHGYHIRKAAAAGIKKEEPALVEQYTRTGLLNALAGELNRTMDSHFPRLKSSDFYQRLQSRFRKEPLNRRFLLLLRLKGLDLHSSYPIAQLSAYRVKTAVTKQHLTVTLQVVDHPEPGRYKADSYFFEVLLLFWDKSKRPATTEWQLTEWIPLDGGKPEFDFGFALPAGTVHWMACLRLQLGAAGQNLDYYLAQGIQIFDMGSFDKQDLAILAERDVKPVPPPPVKAPQEMERIKAKQVL